MARRRLHTNKHVSRVLLTGVPHPFDSEVRIEITSTPVKLALCRSCIGEAAGYLQLSEWRFPRFVKNAIESQKRRVVSEDLD